MVDFFAAMKGAEKPQAQVVTRTPFDLQPVKNVVARFHSEIDRMAAEAKSHNITDDQSYLAAQEQVGRAKKLSSAIEKQRKEIKRPYLDQCQAIDGEIGPLSKKLATLVVIIETKMLTYAREKERLRREAEQKAREEAGRRQAELDRQAREEAARLAEEARRKAEAEGKAREEADAEAAAAAAQVQVPIVVPDIPEETKVQTDSASSKIEADWDWEIEDFSQIPAEIWKEREKQVLGALRPAINAKVKAGIRSIPGVKIFPVERLKTRARR